MADWVTTVLGAVGAVGGGAGLWSFLGKMSDHRQSEILRLRDDIEEFRTNNDKCTEENKKLEARVHLLEQATDSHIARWIKNSKRQMIWVNERAFIGIFAPLGLERDEIIGKTFTELLDPVAAQEVDLLDQAALAHPEVAASNIIKLHPLLPVMVIVKVVGVGIDGGLIYEGFAYRTNDSLVAAGIGAIRQQKAISASLEHALDIPTGGDS